MKTFYTPYVSIILKFKRWMAVYNIVSGVNNHFIISVAIYNVSYNFQDCIYIA